MTFAYIGVELLTMTAYEVRNASQLKGTAMTIALQTCILYVTVVATFVSNVAWNNPQLPQLFQVTSLNSTTTGTVSSRDISSHKSSAIPIIALLDAGNTTLGAVVTGILMYSGLSAANTALYVASRTLYGFARNIDATRESTRFRRFLFRLSDVLPWTGAPIWGVLLPAVALCWLPFIHIKEDVTKQLVRSIPLVSTSRD